VTTARPHRPRLARVVRLEERVGGRWRSRAVRTSTRAGAFRFTVPAGVTERTRPFRVVARRAGGLRALRSAVLTVAVARPRTPAGPPHYALTYRDGQVLRWASCTPIPYLLNPAGAPADWAETVKSALGQVTAATGYTFANHGTTIAGAQQADHAIVLQWAGAVQDPGLAGNVVGRTYWRASSVGGSAMTIESAGIVMDTQLLTWGPATRAAMIRQVLLHELGHAMGLGHVEDRRQVMNSSSDGTLQHYQNGDLAGLSAVGRSAGPCRDAGAASVAAAAPMAPVASVASVA
jgi:hypothetical protein